MSKPKKTAKAKLAKAKTKKAEAKAKRAARAQAKEEKEAKAQALVAETNKEVDGLVARLKLLVDKAEASMVSSMREAAEMTFRLQDKYKLTQFQIGAKIGRSQAWVSTILKWRAAGYPQTAFGPQSKARDARRLSGPDNPKLPAPPKEPDPNVGMPPGPKLALMPDNTIVRVTGNDVDTEASAEARKAVASEDAAATSTLEPEQAPAPAPALALAPAPLTREEISDDLLSKAKNFWREEIAAGITDDDVKKYLGFIWDQKQWKPRARRAA